MTTESRMREALEQALFQIEYIEERCNAGTGSGEKVKAMIREALSPPARRTSEEFDIEAEIDIEGIVRGNSPRRLSDDPYTFGLMQRMVFEGAKAAIATLAGLTPPEEEA